MHKSLRFASMLVLAVALAGTAPALAAPPPDAQSWFGRVWAKIRPPRATASAPNADGSKHRLSIREAWSAVREELQVYRGDRLERLSNFFTVGPSRFDAKLSVADNLKAVVEEKKLPHYYADINGRQVLHVVIDLAQGKQTRKALRSVLRRVGKQTIELNYKNATAKNPYGHVAVRTGGGALFDLTGTKGMAELPAPLAKILNTIRGSSDLSFARRRSLRRFMESRKEADSASVYFGMLFAATPDQIKQTEQIYRQRQGEMKEFCVSGGDASKGVYSCAQYLTEAVPFLNERGIGRNIGAKSMAGSGRGAAALEAVVVYKMPSVKPEQLTFP
jgi:hypothetical protein